MFLFADSQLLFWKDEGGLFLARVKSALDAPLHSLRAAYLGASNGDVRDYYDLFVAAMAGIDIRDCRMIPSSPSAEDRAFFDRADVILLAGGDVERGLRTFQQNGIGERIIARYAEGAVLIGISAGAMQLGRSEWAEPGAFTFETLRLAPMVIDVHDEPDWARLAEVVAKLEGGRYGIGIPSGGGAIIHPDLAVEPVRKPLTEIRFVDGERKRALLVPDAR
jgi:cyanophycinase-like exopeptidase